MMEKFGYIKTKKLGEKENVRSDLFEEELSLGTPDPTNAIELNSLKINNDNLKDFSVRKNLIDEVITNIVKDNKLTVVINLSDVNIEKNYLERLIIELIPRLKEIGGALQITNNNILNSEFLNKYKI